MQTEKFTPSPIRAQTEFMAELTKLHTDYEANMAHLYAGQAEYKAAVGLVEQLAAHGVTAGRVSPSFWCQRLALSTRIESYDGALFIPALVECGHGWRYNKTDNTVRVDGFDRLTIFMPANFSDIEELQSCAA